MKSNTLTIRQYLLLASMLFGMFFGAGNLIFPVLLGQTAGSATPLAIAAFCITGVGLPLLAIAAMARSQSMGLLDMSSKAGKRFGMIFTCLLYLTIGPLFAIPRTATVSFQVGFAPSISPDQQQIFLAIFSLVFFAIALTFSLRPGKIMIWIGKVLNPAFLIVLAVMLGAALLFPQGSMQTVEPLKAYATSSFLTGFLEGYNTMDLLAALAFGIILVRSVNQLGVTDSKKASTSALIAGAGAVALMALIYTALAIAGAQSREALGVSSDGGIALHGIAFAYFGTAGAVVIGLLMTLACLKTSIGLITACGETFEEMFPRIGSYRAYAIGFTIISFILANLGLDAIIRFSIPMLQLLYPIAIVLIFLCLFGEWFHYDINIMSPTIIATAFGGFLTALSALPAEISSQPAIASIIDIVNMLPFATLGFGWVLPCCIGLVIGIVRYALH